MNNADRQLVSILVITYNSDKYIVETLDSIRLQTYENIELIISDDCSTDNTLEIAAKWIDKNRERFTETIIINSEINTGVTENCNRALQKAKGKYLKFIAGDDLLKSNCIKNNIDFITKSNDVILYSKFELIDKNSNRITKLAKKESLANLYSEKFCELTVKEQFKHLIFASYVNATTDFIQTDFLRNLGGFDSDFSIEDYPLLLKISGNGYKIKFMPIVTVSYRIHDESISNKDKEGVFNRKYLKVYPKIIHKYVGKQYFIRHPLIYLHYLLSHTAKNLTVLSGNRMYFYRCYKLFFLLSPYYLYKKLYSIIKKEIFLFYY